MGSLVLERSGRAKTVSISGDKFIRMSGETYSIVADIVSQTGLTYKDALAKLVQFAADNTVIVDREK